MSGRGRGQPPTRPASSSSQENALTYALYPHVRPTIDWFNNRQRIAILKVTVTVSPETYLAFQDSLLGFPYHALTTTEALTEIFPEMQGRPQAALEAHRHYPGYAARVILAHPLFALGILRNAPPTPVAQPPGRTHPLYNPLSSGEFDPVRQDIESLRNQYPGIHPLVPQPSLGRWFDLPELLEKIDIQWHSCGHSRLLFSIFYLAFPTLRPYISARSPIPNHLRNI